MLSPLALELTATLTDYGWLLVKWASIILIVLGVKKALDWLRKQAG